MGAIERFVAASLRQRLFVLLCLAAWAVPGAGHLWQGHRTKGLIFLAALPLMFAIGLAAHGRMFPFDFSEPLVGLAAVADLGIVGDVHKVLPKLIEALQAR